ncbi:MAG: arginine--tRNA ligase [Planctomycetaceae bacterium]
MSQIRARFASALAGLCDAPAEYTALIKPAQDARFGDYQANLAMPLAKALRENPRELAAKIVARLDVSDLCEPPDVAGPGFINLKLRSDWLQNRLGALVPDDRLGVSLVPQPRRIVIDYSSTNVAKPMHVGHLRSTVIGDALYRIHKFLGHHVTGDNHVGDWGTQFGMIIYGYKHFLDADAYARDPVAELARLYRVVNSLCDYHEARAELPDLQSKLAQARSELEAASNAGPAPDKAHDAAERKLLERLRSNESRVRAQIASVESKIAAVENDGALASLAPLHPRIFVAAREETAKLHAGDPENLALWRQFMPECLAAIQKVYERLGVQFDTTLGESFYQPLLAQVVIDLRQIGLATISDGAVCVFIEGIDAPFIVQKSDGAFTYATTDLATIRYRVETLKAQAMYYVVDARQSDHFRLLFETGRRWGYPNVDFRHISFGTILGDDRRPFKTRAGDVVGLESLLDESVSRARRIVDESSSAAELDEQARAQIAESVGIGAIKYADLCQNRETDYVFNWDKMLATTGDTATYMQYAYARVCGIFRKGAIDRTSLRSAGHPITLDAPAERALAVKLIQLCEVLEQAAAECRPNFLTQYLFETANLFSTFFEECPVLKAESEALRASRLLLADLTARVIARGLDLLGIRAIERM